MAKEKFLLNVDKEVLKWIREQAQKANRSVNNYIETKLLELKSNERNAKRR